MKRFKNALLSLTSW